jgi:hypothetical protein
MTQYQHNTTADHDENVLPKLWHHIYGEASGFLCLATGKRKAFYSNDIPDFHQEFFQYPDKVPDAVAWIQKSSQDGLETYFCAHLLTEPTRRKENAAQVYALYADLDEATIPRLFPQPTALIESSPGRLQAFWKLSRPLPPEEAELLNKRIAIALGADKSGFDLTQVLRPPGTTNYKYPSLPQVCLLTLDTETVYDPDDLDAILPTIPKVEPRREPEEPREKITLNDQELVDRMMSAENGEKFSRLWNGDTSAYDGDDSRADQALCNILAWWTNKDANWMDNLFRQSGLYRPKWERQDYRERTITAAIDYVQGSYDPTYSQTHNPTFTFVPKDDGTSSECELALAHLREQLEAVRAERNQLKERVRELELQRTHSFRVLRNQKLQSARVTAIAVVQEVDWLTEQGKADEDGFVTIRLGNVKDPSPWQERSQSNGIADKAGISRSTASRHIKKLAEWGFLDKENSYREIEMKDENGEPIIDYDTGEIGGTRTITEIKLRLREPASATLEALSTFEPDTATHGGRRLVCTHHPTSKLSITHTARCEECGEVVDEWITRQSPTPLDEDHTDEKPHADAELQDATILSVVNRSYRSTMQRGLRESTFSFKGKGPLHHEIPRPDTENAPSKKQPCADCGEPSTSYRCSPCAAAATRPRTGTRMGVVADD